MCRERHNSEQGVERVTVLVLMLALMLGAGLVRPSQAQSYLLDEYPNAYAAYSLRKLRSDYGGPAVRVRRSSDGAEQDFGFVSDDLDVAGIEGWLGNSDGYLVRWYSQIDAHPALVVKDEAPEPPLIARAGTVILDGQGLPRISFFGVDALMVDRPGLPTPVNTGNMAVMLTGESINSMGYILQIGGGGGIWANLSPTISAEGGHRLRIKGVGEYSGDETLHTWSPGSTVYAWNISANTIRFFDKHEGFAETSGVSASEMHAFVTVGAPDRPRSDEFNWDGYLSEIIIFPGLSSEESYQRRYDLTNAYWKVGPANYVPGSLLPQQFDYQVTLYNWLKSVRLQDVTLPLAPLSWDGSYSDVDALADLWIQLEGASASSVVRAEPEWYVLDAGNGKGIEATGTVRIWHQPKGSGDYKGNPPRSWSNEPAFLYQLDIPLSSGGQGNPYYNLPSMGRRALIVAAVDMMMYHREMLVGDGYATWQDMYGKALLGWAEAYRWCKEVLSENVQLAFEEGFEYFLDQTIKVGARAVNTNMDMFGVQAAAEIYMATGSLDLKSKAVAAVRRILFGYPDGELGVRHKVFKAGSDYDGGVFDPSGFIMEGDQPVIFYGGESIYHLMGALAAVTDRGTGDVPAEWIFLEEVVRRSQLWRTYQQFFDPGVASSGVGGIKARRQYHAGASFDGRTSAGVPEGQANEIWRFVSLADRFEESRHVMRKENDKIMLPSVAELQRDIVDKLAYLTGELSSVYTDMPKEWAGWSPWTKATPYLPTRGWYSRLRALIDADDPTTYPPVARRGVHFNRAFGGDPVGEQYWAFKSSDGERDWGFFMEAQARQGTYGGWYGGKIETFWTEATGVVLLSRKGKSGCDGGVEDSECFGNLDYKAGHHVWGRDENGRGFTTLLLRGRELARTSTFRIQEQTPRVSVRNIFNDPSHASKSSSSITGEETGSELEGSVEITNEIEALDNGVRVTHTIVSDGSDGVSELWASIPVFLRLYNPYRAGTDWQADLGDTTIEYWNGASWQPMPEDADVPEIVTTMKLRLGRDFLLGDGPQYVYVGFDEVQRVRLSTQIYHDPYQSKTRVRTVHFDLHGNPGTVKQMPTALSMSYAITTTEPQSESGKSTSVTQTLSLQAGWNLMGGSVQPPDPSIEQLFAEVLPSIAIVKDEQGRIFSPEYDINTIGTWRPDEAYQVYAREAVELQVSGTPLIPSETPITLTAGWNLLPFIGASSMPVADALQSIQGAVVIVKDNDGNVYYPEAGLNQIGQLQAGRGYKIYVTQDATLYYPE